MKYVVAFFMVVLGQLTTYSQYQGDSLIKGGWKVDFDRTIAEMTLPEREHYDQMEHSIKLKMRTTFSSRAFNFGDGSIVNIELTTADDKQHKLTGVWTYLNGRLVIKIGNDSHAYRVEVTDSDRIILRYENVLREASISSLCLVRNH